MLMLMHVINYSFDMSVCHVKGVLWADQKKKKSLKEKQVWTLTSILYMSVSHNQYSPNDRAVTHFLFFRNTNLYFQYDSKCKPVGQYCFSLRNSSQPYYAMRKKLYFFLILSFSRTLKQHQLNSQTYKKISACITARLCQETDHWGHNGECK